MPVKKSEATAFIKLTGLGIICFNPKKKRCEAAIIRDDKHKLTIKISKPMFIDEGGKDRLAYVDVISYPLIDSKDVTIEISGEGNSTIDGYEKFEGEKFSRQDVLENDPNDFRWIVNLEGEEFHNAKLKKNQNISKINKPNVTKLFISNGLFYSVMPDYTDEKEAKKLISFKKVDETANQESDFGYIAETMGVNIESDKVCLKIKIGKTENIHYLERIPGNPFRIELTNSDPDPESEMSDFPILYQFLNDEKGQKFSLKPEDDENKGKSVFGRDFCHVAYVNQESIDDFI